MILVRAPLRISYIGGGSDYPTYFKKSNGHVLGATIDKFVYIYANPLASIAKEKIRFSYRQTESVNSLEELEHPVVREMLRFFDWNSPLNIGSYADLPSGVGLGGSSAFAVGLTRILSQLKGDNLSPIETAQIAIKVERKILNESGGYQDQVQAAIGGFREYIFSPKSLSYSEPLLNPNSLKYLQERQLLIWTGGHRDSHGHANFTNSKTSTEEVNQVAILARDFARKLRATNDPKISFELLAEAVVAGWAAKQTFSTPLDPHIKQLEADVMSMGALAVKLCGAGGEGFLLVLGEPHSITSIRNHVDFKQSLNFNFTNFGVETLTQI